MCISVLNSQKCERKMGRKEVQPVFENMQNVSLNKWSKDEKFTIYRITALIFFVLKSLSDAQSIRGNC